jgi:hypothetical protein
LVQFSLAELLGLYPVFTPQSAVLSQNFTLATTLLNNTCGSRVQDANLRQTLLYLLTCHITALNNGVGSTPATGLVGRISDGSEGSVSATAEYETGPAGPNQAYFVQTQWGATFWTATAAFRTMRYFPSRQGRIGQPWGYPFGNGGF